MSVPAQRPIPAEAVCDFIRGMPKVELHLHLEGSIRAELLFELGTKNGQELLSANVDELRARYQYETFEDFVLLFVMGVGALRDHDDFEAVTVALVDELLQQNVRYAEVITSPMTHHMHHTPHADYLGGLNAGRHYAAANGLELNWILDISRNFGDEAVDAAFAVVDSGKLDGLIGVGLGGAEAGFPPHPFADAFARARAAGLRCVAHAGETFGPASIVGAIEELKAERIGHGTHSIDDPELVKRLVDEGIPLELAPTSNLRLNVIDSYEAHPMPSLSDAGVTLTANSDDPAMFDTTLTDEIEIVAALCSLDIEGVRSLQHDAIDVSFADAATKTRLRAELDSYSAAG